jgi:hypothetical protein
MRLNGVGLVVKAGDGTSRLYVPEGVSKDITEYPDIQISSSLNSSGNNTTGNVVDGTAISTVHNNSS